MVDVVLRLDKEKSGLVPLQRIFTRFEMDRTIFTDCLLDLLEIEHGKNSSNEYSIAFSFDDVFS